MLSSGGGGAFKAIAPLLHKHRGSTSSPQCPGGCKGEGREVMGSPDPSLPSFFCELIGKQINLSLLTNVLLSSTRWVSFSIGNNVESGVEVVEL